MKFNLIDIISMLEVVVVVMWFIEVIVWFGDFFGSDQSEQISDSLADNIVIRPFLIAFLGWIGWSGNAMFPIFLLFSASTFTLLASLFFVIRLWVWWDDRNECRQSIEREDDYY